VTGRGPLCSWAAIAEGYQQARQIFQRDLAGSQASSQ
jgi:hypothetical protein